MIIHTGENSFECSICCKSFIRNDVLQSHSMTHTDGLPHACSKCRRRFATSQEKQTHEMRCQRSLYACNHCHYKNVYMYCLKRHTQSKHGAERSIECEVCIMKFVQQTELNKHLSEAHCDRFSFECSKCFKGYTTEGEKIAHEVDCGYRRYQ